MTEVNLSKQTALNFVILLGVSVDVVIPSQTLIRRSRCGLRRMLIYEQGSLLLRTS
jgi:hypothetical protein